MSPYDMSIHMSADVRRSDSFAIVSGRGGAGKTIFSVSLALELARVMQTTMIVDSDFATSGLSHYLLPICVKRAPLGLADLMAVISKSPEHRNQEPMNASIAPEEILHQSKNYVSDVVERLPLGLIAAGTRKNRYAIDEGAYLSEIRPAIQAINRQTPGFHIFDCRGGLDRETEAICNEVSNIIIVMETDAASIQSTSYLIDRLQATGADHKLRGIVLNKVFTDPSALMDLIRARFGTDVIAVLPFEADTMRTFLVGQLVRNTSRYGRDIKRLAVDLLNGSSESGYFFSRTIWQSSDFGSFGISDRDEELGRRLIALTVTVLLAFIFFASFYRVMANATCMDVQCVKPDKNLWLGIISGLSAAGLYFQLTGLFRGIVTKLGRLIRASIGGA